MCSQSVEAVDLATALAFEQRFPAQVSRGRDDDAYIMSSMAAGRSYRTIACTAFSSLTKTLCIFQDRGQARTAGIAKLASGIQLCRIRSSVSARTATACFAGASSSNRSLHVTFFSRVLARTEMCELQVAHPPREPPHIWKYTVLSLPSTRFRSPTLEHTCGQL